MNETTAVQSLLALVVVIATLALGIAYRLLMRQLTRALEIIERVPTQQWLDDVSESLKRIPSEDFLDRALKHFDWGHEHAQVLGKHELRLDKLDRKVAELEKATGPGRAG